MPMMTPSSDSAANQSPISTKPVSPAATNEYAALEKEILSQLVGKVDPVRRSFGYKAAMLLVAFMMVLLPVLYLSLIGGIAWSLYLCATGNLGWVNGRNFHGQGDSPQANFAMYYAPFAAGFLLILFLIKPILARVPKHDSPHPLTREDEPLLFAFVERLCSIVGASPPSQIQVNCQVNAAASFRLGWLSLFGRKDLVLTIGLPLAAGFDLQHFAGILAHEFGHFTQGWGLRLSYTIRSINHWFTRVVYERDRWDQWLATWSRRGGFLMSFLLLTQIFVWLTRKALWVLMVAGHVVSGMLLRQMEFNADLYEARLVGSNSFDESFRRLNELNVASQTAFADLNRWYKENRLADDLPRLIVANAKCLPADILLKIDEKAGKSTTGWFDTHPVTRDRVAQAKLENTTGIFHNRLPATVLFSDFNALAKSATRVYYNVVLNCGLTAADLQSTEQLLAERENEKPVGHALARYFQSCFHTLRPLPLAGKVCTQECGNQDATVVTLQSTRAQILAGQENYVKAFQDFCNLDVQLAQVTQAAAAIEAALRGSQHGQWHHHPKNYEEVQQLRTNITRQAKELSLLLEAFEESAAVRLTTAIQWLNHLPVLEKMEAMATDWKLMGPNQSIRENANEWLSVAIAIGNIIPDLVELRDHQEALQFLVSKYNRRRHNKRLTTAILRWTKQLNLWMNSLRESLTPLRYPFKHGQGELNVFQAFLKEVPPANDVSANMSAAAALLNRLPTFFLRLMAHLAAVAEMVEQCLGLPPLENQKPETHVVSGNR